MTIQTNTQSAATHSMTQNGVVVTHSQDELNFLRVAYEERSASILATARWVGQTIRENVRCWLDREADRAVKRARE